MQGENKTKTEGHLPHGKMTPATSVDTHHQPAPTTKSLTWCSVLPPARSPVLCFGDRMGLFWGEGARGTSRARGNPDSKRTREAGTDLELAQSHQAKGIGGCPHPGVHGPVQRRSQTAILEQFSGLCYIRDQSRSQWSLLTLKSMNWPERKQHHHHSWVRGC